jgi:hypothetical protein
MCTLSKKLKQTSNWYRLFAGFALCVLSWSAIAQQRIVGADRRQVEVAISAKEHNDISIVGGVVSKIRVVKGKIDYKRDSSGVLSFVMATDEPQTVSVTVIDEDNNRYNLLLVPKPIPQQDISIVPTGSESATITSSAGALSSAQSTTSYQRRLKQFAQSVINHTNNVGGSAVGFTKQVVNESIPLWKEASLRYLARFVEGDMVAEHYELNNTTNETLQVLEAELMRPGVIGIYLNKQSLAPRESTTLIVLRGRSGNE